MFRRMSKAFERVTMNSEDRSSASSANIEVSTSSGEKRSSRKSKKRHLHKNKYYAVHTCTSYIDSDNNIAINNPDETSMNQANDGGNMEKTMTMEEDSLNICDIKNKHPCISGLVSK